MATHHTGTMTKNSPTEKTRKAILAIQNELNGSFLERSDVIEGMIIGALTKQHVFMLGLPGTAKTAMIRSFAERITGSQYWGQLCTKFSSPEDFFGAPSIAALKADQGLRRHPDGTIRKGHFILLDEIFKSSAAIRSALLTILNERIYYEAGEQQIIPLMSALLASNELPTEREDHAFWDRIPLRYNVERLNSKLSVQKMLNGGGFVKNPTTITLKELQAAQKAVMEIKVPASVMKAAADLFMSLREEGVDISERAMMQSAGNVSPVDGEPILSLVKASAWLAGLEEAATEDLAILSNCFWRRTEEIKEIKKIVMTVAAPDMGDLDKIRDQFSKIKKIMKEAENTHGNLGDIFIKVNDISKKALKLADRAKRDPRIKKKLEALINEVDDAKNALLGKLGMWSDPDAAEKVIKARNSAAKENAGSPAWGTHKKK